MIVPRRPGHIEVIHPNGRVARQVHRATPLDSELIYVRISPYVSANWSRAECTFRFVPENSQGNR